MRKTLCVMLLVVGFVAPRVLKAQDDVKITPTGKIESEKGVGESLKDFFQRLRKEKRLQLTFEDRIKYDTNPAVVSNGEKEDWADVLKFSIDGKIVKTKQHQVGYRYNFYGEFYSDEDKNDLVGHVGDIYFSVAADPIMLRIDCMYSHYLVDDKSYLRKSTVAPMLFYKSGSNMLEMLRISLSSNDYVENDNLDGPDHSIQLRHFHFLDKAKKKRVSFGYRYMKVDTNDSTEDYFSHRVRGDFKTPIFPQWDMTLMLSVGYTHKVFDAGSRKDNKMEYDLEITKKINNIWTVLAGYDGTYNNSGNNNAEYDRGIGYIGVKAVF